MRAGEELECVHAGGASGDGNQRIKKETMRFCGWEERETRDKEGENKKKKKKRDRKIK